jgi:hypothetical protein
VRAPPAGPAAALVLPRGRHRRRAPPAAAAPVSQVPRPRTAPPGPFLAARFLEYVRETLTNS